MSVMSAGFRLLLIVVFERHCEERSDEAIHAATERKMDCFAALAMTEQF